MNALADHGIHLRHDQPGKHRAACPECARAKPRPRDTAVSVTIEPDGGAVWKCHRCTWKGNARAPASPQERRKAQAKGIRPPRPERRPTGFPAPTVALWRTTSVIIEGTPAASYLAARGCALPHPDGDLRFLASHRHPCGWRGPCLVALVTDAVTAMPMTLHRTWILPDGHKAPVDRPRLLWPGLPKAGGLVRLWPDDAVTLGLLIGEGIETSFAAAAGFGLACATVDAGNMAGLPVLPGIECLTIVSDHDANGRGQAAAEACARRWLAAGVEVRIWIAPTPGEDFADHLLEGAA